ncbi:CYTH domain-containing protein [Devosia sp. 63-57]|uniref:CYTH domain-containing protein n=1 Tax=Devosia sp. 63-57 TaxID=1895751 RepID=UPI00086986C9|nr:CYTH domain-containing protein [Devosia sp. 63-57]ODT49844.1 MAG: adenylate cyclase [Pelagibacterium sp. SCN 63-126]ODU86277.1 MAG: adenylate cyclase [Pelagibacterium sp. SCN 63-17]OJX45219.1 MAG: adenylate cyclase [Devosia sp. 63-57]
MGVEIERKFLVLGDSWREAVIGSSAMRQGYLSTSAKATVRIRIVDDARAFLTLKGPTSGISRAEFEYEVPLDEGRAMLDMARPHVVEKRRHIVPHAGLTWEVDVFEGAHAGLVMAEVELVSADQAVALPDWAGPEVSHDDRYANASLSRMPGVPIATAS